MTFVTFLLINLLIIGALPLVSSIAPLKPGVDGYDQDGYDVDIEGEQFPFCKWANSNSKRRLGEDYSPHKPRIFLGESIPGIEGDMAKKLMSNRDWIEDVMNKNRKPEPENDNDEL